MRISIFFLMLLFPFFTNAQILNADFNDWIEPLTNSSHHDELIQMGIMNPQRGTPQNWESSMFGVCRMDNGCGGGYGLLMYSWYHGEPGFLTQTFPVTNNPTALTGCYKSILFDTADVALIRYAEIIAWKNNDTIGYTQFSFESSEDFELFEISISYENDQTADSITISFHSDVSGSIDFPVDGLIFLDQLKIDYTTSTKTMGAIPSKSFNIYPNPIQHSLFIDCEKKGNYTYEIFDLTGMRLKKGSLLESSNKLDIIDFPNGLYFFNIADQEKNRLVRKFLKVTE